MEYTVTLISDIFLYNPSIMRNTFVQATYFLNRFDPDRFSAENMKNRPAFAFEPFGFAGKRKCFGWRFSIVEATVVLASIVGRFNLTMVPGQDVVPDYGFITIPSEEMWITATKRD